MIQYENTAIIGDSYEEIYRACLEVILREPHNVVHIAPCSGSDEVHIEDSQRCFIEMVDFGFQLENPLNRMVWNLRRGANYEFAMKLAIWIFNGCNDFEYLAGVNPNAAKYIDHAEEKTATFDTAYGPRVVAQLSNAITELCRNRGTRRAVVEILDSDDQKILGAETKTEYPCTESLTFFIRDNFLHCKASMRSNNMVTTVVYDVFVFTMLQEYVLKMLRELAYPGLMLGHYYHRATSAHIYTRDAQFAKEIRACCDYGIRRIYAK